jgi:hypothetical protein
MTLALIFFICLLCSSPGQAVVSASRIQSGGQQESASKPGDAAATPTPAKTSGSQEQTPSPSTTASPQTSSGENQPSARKRRWHKGKKKPPAAPDCNSSATTTNSAAADATSPGNGAAANPSKASAPGAASSATAGSPGGASSNCPPPKIVVIHDGSTSEPAIQLTGGAGGEQASHQRSTDQLLGATDENLKKIAGRQLSASQQEMVTQIQQFIEQSKAAVAAKDMERGHNLALKAHLLSEELTKP